MDFSNNSLETAKTAAIKLLAYCRANNFEGYDPYDVLNSEVVKGLPFLDFRLPRLVLTQLFKRSPVNLRPFLRVPKTQNPKAIALFLMAFLKLEKAGLLNGQEKLVESMIRKLANLRSPGISYWCWGYSFPWQTRTIIVPRGTPNLVCTTFVAEALINAYEYSGNAELLNMATSAGEYILNELYWTDGNGTTSFAYPLSSIRSQVHNANFLGAGLLCRVSKITGNAKFLQPALQAARYSAGKQRKDGSWDYGECSTEKWVDNFHTGYNLCALKAICDYAGTSEFESHIRRGLDFYLMHFFREDGAPKYFHNRTYPFDIHSVAQSIITLLALKDLDATNAALAHKVFRWAMAHMRDEQGYFYYRVYPFFKSKIPYMRWSQAWMLLALSTLVEHCDQAPVSKPIWRGDVQRASAK